jgi:hypothetical protein
MSERRTNWPAVWTTVGAVAAVLSVIIAVIALPQLQQKSDSEPPESAPSTQTSAPEEEPTDPETANVEQSPSPSTKGTPPTAAEFVPAALTLDDAAQTERCHPAGNTGNSWEEELVSIAGTAYTSAFSCSLNYDSPAMGWIDYLVPPGATSLHAVAGQADDSPGTTGVARFEVIDALDNTVLATHDLGVGEAAPIDVPVEGVIRVRLQVSFVSSAESARDYPIIVAFGEPAFR